MTDTSLRRGVPIATRRRAAGFWSLLLVAACAPAQPASVPQRTPPGGASAAARMSEAGPEQSELATQVGPWDVVATLWPAPGADPIVTQSLVAERTMIGPNGSDSISERVTQDRGPAGAVVNGNE